MLRSLRHLMISVSNIETSKPFYEAVLGLLNYDLAHGSDTYAMGACIAPSLSSASPLREVWRRRVFFNWAQEGERFMYSSDATTGDEPVRLPLFPSDPADAASHFDVTPSPDGGWITFASTQNSRSQDIFVMRPDGSDITNLTQSDGSADYEPTWSPVPLLALPTAIVNTSWGQIKSGNQKSAWVHAMENAGATCGRFELTLHRIGCVHQLK